MRTGPCTLRRCWPPPRASPHPPLATVAHAILSGDAETLQNMADPAADHGGATASGRCGRHAGVRAVRSRACRRCAGRLPASRCGQRRHARRQQAPCQAPRMRRLLQFLRGRADAALPHPACRTLQRRATSRHRNGHLADRIHSRRPAPAAETAFRIAPSTSHTGHRGGHDRPTSSESST